MKNKYAVEKEKSKMTDFLEGKIKKLQMVEERRKNQI
jgi:hypothetical protein